NTIDKLVLYDTDMINKMRPVLTKILADIFLKEHMRRVQAVTLVIDFAGTFFIIKPAFDLGVVPYILGFLSAVFAAGAYTVLRVLGDKEQFYTVVFYLSFFTSVIFLAYVVIFYETMIVKQ